MPGLDAIIANVETKYLPDLPNRAPDADLTVNSKADYKRHTLVGMNLFANQMFQQFPQLLGNSAKNVGSVNTIPPLLLAEKKCKFSRATIRRTSRLSGLAPTNSKSPSPTRPDTNSRAVSVSAAPSSTWKRWMQMAIRFGSRARSMTPA
ncbi:MAG: hypothetical protein U5O39_03475 [Gammaproteobacteria bacterium]|nr:hypothetical protein [Gammaproteobacteria bacterium]